MRLFANVIGVIGALITTQAFAANSCKVDPSPNVSVESLEVELLGQKTVRIHFHTIAGPASDTCLIVSENQSQMIIECPNQHGKVELVVAGNNSEIRLSAKGRSGQQFNASAPMSCR